MGLILGIGNCIPMGNKGINWSSFWLTLISATIENADPDAIVLTFPSAKALVATDFTVTVNGVARNITSATWVGSVLTLVLASDVAYGDVVVVTFIKSGGTANVTNNIALVPEFKAVYDEWVTKPPANKAALWNRMVKQFVDSGVWANFDVFQYYAIHTNDNNEALLDWKNPTITARSASLHGAVVPSFIPYIGFKGNSANGAYIDTKFNPQTNGVNYTLNDACWGYFITSEAGGAGISGSYGTTGISTGTINTGANVINGIINQTAASSNVNPQSDLYGTYVVNRTASNVVKVSSNETIYINNSGASTAVPGISFYMLARNRYWTTPDQFTDRSFSSYFAGGSLTEPERLSLSSGLKLQNYYKDKIYGNHIPLSVLPIYVSYLHQFSFEGCNGKLYAMGGISKYNFEYNPATNVWTRKSDLPFAEVYKQSSILRAVGNKLYFIGGLDNNSVLSNKVYEYDPATDTYTEKSPIPTAREDFGSAVVGTKIYCFGGLKGGTPTWTKTLEIYDTVSDSWSTGADLPEFKQLGDFGCACNGMVYAISGSPIVYAGEGVQNVTPAKTCYKYDPSTDIWTRIADNPIGTVYNERAVSGHYIYISGGPSGGELGNPANYTKAIQRYNTLTDVWDIIHDAPFGLQGSAMAELNDKIYLLSGGVGATGTLEFYELTL